MTRRIGAGVLTGAAVLLVLVALTFPDRLDQLHPSAFLRLPVEALVYLVVVLLIPARLHALRTGLALVAGLLLGLTMILRLLDMGFLQALNRPFDVVIDWTYTRDLIELVRDSFGKGLGTVMLLVAAVLAIGLLVLLPLAVLRLTRLTVGHRQAGLRTVAALVTVWLVLAVMDVRVSTGDVASRDTSGYLYGQVSRIPSVLRDQRQFETAAQKDSLRRYQAADLVSGLRGKDVLFVFVESYGKVAVQDSSLSKGISKVLASSPRISTRTGSRVAAPGSRRPRSGRSAGWRTRRSSPVSGSTASSATTCWSPAGGRPSARSSGGPGGGPSPTSRPTTGPGRRAPSTSTTTSTTRATSATGVRGSATPRCRTSSRWTRSTGSSWPGRTVAR